jgi:hypothetical protein
MTALFRLLGALEITPLRVEKVPVFQVKKLVKEILQGERNIEGITFQKGRGKGWNFQGEKISLHQLEAYLVYWWWQTRKVKDILKENNSLGRFAWEPSKVKQKTKQILSKEN